MARRLKTGTVARMYGVTPQAVWKWITVYGLPAKRTPGGHYRIDEDELTAFAAKRARERNDDTPKSVK